MKTTEEILIEIRDLLACLVPPAIRKELNPEANEIVNSKWEQKRSKTLK